MELAKVLNSWNMTLVGTVKKKTKYFCHATCSLPRKGLFIQPILPTIVMQHNMPKKKKGVVNLSFMYMSGKVERTLILPQKILPQKKRQCWYYKRWVSTLWNDEHCGGRWHFFTMWLTSLAWHATSSIENTAQGLEQRINEESFWNSLPICCVCPRLKLVVIIGWWWGTIFFEVQWKWCLDDKLWPHEKMLLSLVLLMVVVDLLRLLAVVVSAETREGSNEKPGKALWFAGSLSATNIQYPKRNTSLMKMNKLFFLYSFLHVVNTLIDLCCFNKITSSLKNHD